MLYLHTSIDLQTGGKVHTSVVKRAIPKFLEQVYKIVQGQGFHGFNRSYIMSMSGYIGDFVTPTPSKADQGKSLKIMKLTMKVSNLIIRWFDKRTNNSYKAWIKHNRNTYIDYI